MGLLYIFSRVFSASEESVGFTVRDYDLLIGQLREIVLNLRMPCEIIRALFLSKSLHEIHTK